MSWTIGITTVCYLFLSGALFFFLFREAIDIFVHIQLGKIVYISHCGNQL